MTLIENQARIIGSLRGKLDEAQAIIIDKSIANDELVSLIALKNEEINALGELVRLQEIQLGNQDSHIRMIQRQLAEYDRKAREA